MSLLHALRSDTATHDLPVILLSARAGEEARIEGLDAGADDYLVKPFFARELVARVGGVLQLWRLRRDTGEALRESEARFRALLSSLLDPTVAIDAHGTIQTTSESVERVLGWKPSELIGQNIRILMPEPHHSAHDGYLAEYRRTGRTNILGRTREFEVVRRDGSLVTCGLSVARADLPGGPGPLFIGAFRDMTELKAAQKAETAMLRSLATIGESAAVLAHEIKNPITAVNVALRAVAAHLGEDQKAVLEDLVARMKHLEHLMRRTLSFSRPLQTTSATSRSK
jgi:PAS domain S-box-containing protein